MTSKGNVSVRLFARCRSQLEHRLGWVLVLIRQNMWGTHSTMEVLYASLMKAIKVLIITYAVPLAAWSIRDANEAITPADKYVATKSSGPTSAVMLLLKLREKKETEETFIHWEYDHHWCINYGTTAIACFTCIELSCCRWNELGWCDWMWTTAVSWHSLWNLENISTWLLLIEEPATNRGRGHLRRQFHKMFYGQYFVAATNHWSVTEKLSKKKSRFFPSSFLI